MNKRTLFMGVLIGLLCSFGTPVTGRAVGEEIEVPRVMIAELSPESKNAASEEYVVLYNPGKLAVDVTGWQLQYRSASHTPDDQKGWSIKAILGCAVADTARCKDAATHTTSIAAGETLRLATYEMEDGVLPLTSGMATTGGEVRLVGSADAVGTPTIYDLVGYGSAKTFEGAAPSIAPKAGQSIVRLTDTDKMYQDTDDSSKDFVLSPDEDADMPAENVPGAGAGGGPYLDAVITEVFPDPASPQLDSADEFIELYNPYDASLDLTGYTLVTGTSWSHKYTLKDVTIYPHDYVVFMSSETHISLSNSGSGVRLLDPNGAVVFEAPSYGKAVSGASWLQDTDGKWAWTTSPTPGEANIIAAPIAKATSTVAGATKKKASTTKASTAKKASATSKKVAAATKNPGEGATPAEGPKASSNYIVFAIAGAIAAGYIVFEYRRDIATYARHAWQTMGGWFGRK